MLWQHPLGCSMGTSFVCSKSRLLKSGGCREWPKPWRKKRRIDRYAIIGCDDDGWWMMIICWHMVEKKTKNYWVVVVVVVVGVVIDYSQASLSKKMCIATEAKANLNKNKTTTHYWNINYSIGIALKNVKLRIICPMLSGNFANLQQQRWNAKGSELSIINMLC